MRKLLVSILLLTCNFAYAADQYKMNAYTQKLDIAGPIGLSGNGGNVGIGTTLPNDKLTVSSTTGGITIDGAYSGIGGINSNTKIAVLMQGANGSTSFLDSAFFPHVFTTNGNAQISTAQSPFAGGSSGYFDGTGDFLTTPDTQDVAYGSADFTIRARVRPDDTTTRGAVVSQYNGNGANSGMYFAVNESTGTVAFGWSTGGVDNYYFTTNNIITANNWQQLEFVRSGSTCYFFKDGIEQTKVGVLGSCSSAGATNYAGKFTIGARSNDDSSYNIGFKGYIAEVEIIPGVALHTANYDPATSVVTSEASLPTLTFSNSGTTSASIQQSNQLGTLSITNNSNTTTIDQNGNLGVGSTTPGVKLDVNGVIRTTSAGTAASPSLVLRTAGNGLSAAITNTLAVSTNGSQRMTVDSSGNVGIGSVAPAYGLDVGLSTAKFGNSSGMIDFNQSGSTAQLRFTGTGPNLIYTAGYASQLKIDGSSLALNSASLGNVGIGTSVPLGTLMVNGNVGIGTLTATPTANLEVVGLMPGVRIEKNASSNVADPPSPGGAPSTPSYANSYLHLGGREFGTNSYRTISFGYEQSAKTNVPAYLGYQEINNTGSTFGDLVFGTRSANTDTQPTERFRITNAGNIGIGTLAPKKLLDLFSSSDSVAGLVFTGGANGFINSDQSVYVNIDDDNDQTDRVFVVGNNRTTTTSGNSFFIVNEQGNVGIGTVTPQGAFVVTNGNVGLGTWSPTNNLQLMSTTTGLPGMSFTTTAGNTTNLTRASVIYTGATTTDFGIMPTGKLYLGGNTTSALVVQTDSNVGIGTNIPGGGLVVINGNVGVGTWIPSSPFTVKGTTITQRINGANTACSTTCGAFACYGGFDTALATGDVWVDCADATADKCQCSK